MWSMRVIAGVERVATVVAAHRVEVIGTADASTVATAIGAKTRRSVKVLSDPGGTCFSGYKHKPMEKVDGNNANVAATTTQADGNDAKVATTATQARADSHEALWRTEEGWYGATVGNQHWSTGDYSYYNYYSGEGEVYGGEQGPRAYQTLDGYYYSEGPLGEVLPDQHQQNGDENSSSNCCIK
jgi:hypothetical protein